MVFICCHKGNFYFLTQFQEMCVWFESGWLHSLQEWLCLNISTNWETFKAAVLKACEWTKLSYFSLYLLMNEPNSTSLSFTIVEKFQLMRKMYLTHFKTSLKHATGCAWSICAVLQTEVCLIFISRVTIIYPGFYYLVSQSLFAHISPQTLNLPALWHAFPHKILQIKDSYWYSLTLFSPPFFALTSSTPWWWMTDCQI